MKLNRPKQYRDYLLRYAESAPPMETLALTYDEFCTVVDVWVREYHVAWIGNDIETMAQLEHALQLSPPCAKLHWTVIKGC